MLAWLRQTNGLGDPDYDVTDASTDRHLQKGLVPALSWFNFIFYLTVVVQKHQSAWKRTASTMACLAITQVDS